MTLTTHEPHPERSEEVNYNPTSSGRLLFQLWDIVALFGPMPEEDIYAKHYGKLVVQDSYTTAWYIEEHPDEKAPSRDERSSDAFTTKALKYCVEREIDQAIRRGWFVIKSGEVGIGTLPGQHTPFEWLGGEKRARTFIDRETSRAAIEILRAKANPARMKPMRGRVTELRKDMEARAEAGVGHESGQLYPIIVWEVRDERFIIDGQTRWEAQRRRGVEPWVEVRPFTDAREALWTRISAELLSTTKDQSTEARDAYIAQLAEEGLTQKEIAKRVGLSQNRISEVLSTISADRYRGQPEPSEADIDEWVKLSDAGHTYRDIAQETAWSKSLVAKKIKLRRATAKGTSTKPDPRANPGTQKDLVLRAIEAEPEGLTDAEIEAATGLGYSLVGPRRRELMKDEFVRANGRRGGKTVYTTTSEGAEVAEVNELLEPAEPDSEPDVCECCGQELP